MIDLLHLKTFCVITDTNSFTLAAHRLGCSQPTVTTHIRALEVALGGVRLFERHRFSRNVVLTEIGKRTLGYAQLLLDLAEKAPAAVRPHGG